MRITKDPAERKQEILDIALALFIKKGYEKTSVKDIVTEVGVAQGLFYYYFPSKEKVVAEIGLQFTQNYKEVLKPAIIIGNTDPIKATQVFFKISFSFFQEHLKLIHSCHDGNVRLHNIMDEAIIAPIIDFFTNIIKSGNEKNIFDCLYPEKTSKAFVYGVLYVSGITESILNIKNEKEFIIYLMARLLNADSKKLVDIL